MNFGDAVKSGFKKYFDFNGRASRSEFWLWTLFTIILALFGFMLDVAFGWGNRPLDGSGPLVTLAYVVTLIPTYAVMVRRLHDTDRSAWWLGGVVLGSIALIAILLLIVRSGGQETEALSIFVGIAGLALIGFSITITVFLCLRGTQGANRFGLLEFASGGTSDVFPQSSAHRATAIDLGVRRWVLSGFDSVGNIIRFEFNITSGQSQNFVIGRNREVCDLVIADQGVSRQHAEISVSGSGVYIRDLGSSNGTFVNGQRLTGEFLPFPMNGTLTLGPIELSVFGS
jgi:uncharacterized membrane protein YhaH (DUF805 family)